MTNFVIGCNVRKKKEAVLLRIPALRGLVQSQATIRGVVPLLVIAESRGIASFACKETAGLAQIVPDGHCGRAQVFTAL